MTRGQFDLFGAAADWAEGFRYQPEVITPQHEAALAEEIGRLPLKPFEFHQYPGNRRTAAFGWSYDFERETIRKADDVPEFLAALRSLAAAFAGLKPAELQQVLVIEYAPGAGIGWHRDRPVFGDVVGISLLAPCRFRLRRRAGSGWERIALIAEPRSAYLLHGASRTEWEHSIPPVEELRYSVTFRNLRGRA